jgi:hypothetical protein
MPTRVGLDVEDDDATPTPCEATRRLASITEEVQCKRKSPLIASPPRQKAVTKRPATNQEQADCRSAIVACSHL